jgi:hypothetical protein
MADRQRIGREVNPGTAILDGQPIEAEERRDPRDFNTGRPFARARTSSRPLETDDDSDIVAGGVIASAVAQCA